MIQAVLLLSCGSGCCSWVLSAEFGYFVAAGRAAVLGFETTGTMIDMCLSLILSHSMQHFLDQHDLHLLAMGFNSSTVTYLLLCSVTKTIWSLSLNFFAHTNMTDMQ